MALKIIALRPEGGLGNPTKILSLLQKLEGSDRQVQSRKFVVFRNKENDLVMAIGYGVHPILAKHAAPHVGEGFGVNSGGKISFHPVDTDRWQAVVGGWSTTYEGPPTLDLFRHTEEIARTLGMRTTFRWEVMHAGSNFERFPVTDLRADLDP